MIKKLRNQPYAPKWEQTGRKKNRLVGRVSILERARVAKSHKGAFGV
jgi:hypothetical protein